jgi:hypothetical protein
LEDVLIDLPGAAAVLTAACAGVGVGFVFAYGGDVRGAWIGAVLAAVVLGVLLVVGIRRAKRSFNATAPAEADAAPSEATDSNLDAEAAASTARAPSPPR